MFLDVLENTTKKFLFNNLERFHTQKKSFTAKVHVEELSLEVDGKFPSKDCSDKCLLDFLCVQISHFANLCGFFLCR